MHPNHFSSQKQEASSVSTINLPFHIDLRKNSAVEQKPDVVKDAFLSPAKQVKIECTSREEESDELDSSDSIVCIPQPACQPLVSIGTMSPPQTPELLSADHDSSSSSAYPYSRDDEHEKVYAKVHERVDQTSSASMLSSRLQSAEVTLALALLEARNAKEKASKAESLANEARSSAESSNLQVTQFQSKTVTMRKVEERIEQVVRSEILQAVNALEQKAYAQQQESLLAVKVEMAELRGMILATWQGQLGGTFRQHLDAKSEEGGSQAVPSRIESWMEISHHTGKSGYQPSQDAKIENSKKRKEAPSPDDYRKEKPLVGRKRAKETTCHSPSSGSSLSDDLRELQRFYPMNTKLAAPFGGSEPKPLTNDTKIAAAKESSRPTPVDEKGAAFLSDNDVGMTPWPSLLFGLVYFMQEQKEAEVTDSMLRSYVRGTEDRNNAIFFFAHIGKMRPSDEIIKFCQRFIHIGSFDRAYGNAGSIKVHRLTKFNAPFLDKAVNSQYVSYAIRRDNFRG